MFYVFSHLASSVRFLFNEPSLNPFTASACNISGLNDTRTRLLTVYFYFYFPVLQHLLSVLWVLMTILSHARAKNKTKSARVSNFALLWVIFKWSHNSEGVTGRLFFPTLENERPCNRMFVMTTFFFLSFCLMSSDAKEHSLLGRIVCKASLCWIYVMTTTTIISYTLLVC